MFASNINGSSKHSLFSPAAIFVPRSTTAAAMYAAILFPHPAPGCFLRKKTTNQPFVTHIPHWWEKSISENKFPSSRKMCAQTKNKIRAFSFYCQTVSYFSFSASSRFQHQNKFLYLLSSCVVRPPVSLLPACSKSFVIQPSSVQFAALGRYCSKASKNCFSVAILSSWTPHKGLFFPPTFFRLLSTRKLCCAASTNSHTQQHKPLPFFRDGIIFSRKMWLYHTTHVNARSRGKHSSQKLRLPYILSASAKPKFLNPRKNLPLQPCTEQLNETTLTTQLKETWIEKWDFPGVFPLPLHGWERVRVQRSLSLWCCFV